MTRSDLAGIAGPLKKALWQPPSPHLVDGTVHRPTKKTCTEPNDFPPANAIDLIQFHFCKILIQRGSNSDQSERFSLGPHKLVRTVMPGVRTWIRVFTRLSEIKVGPTLSASYVNTHEQKNNETGIAFKPARLAVLV